MCSPTNRRASSTILLVISSKARRKHVKTQREIKFNLLRSVLANVHGVHQKAHGKRMNWACANTKINIDDFMMSLTFDGMLVKISCLPLSEIRTGAACLE